MQTAADRINWLLKHRVCTRDSFVSVDQQCPSCGHIASLHMGVTACVICEMQAVQSEIREALIRIDIRGQELDGRQVQRRSDKTNTTVAQDPKSIDLVLARRLLRGLETACRLPESRPDFTGCGGPAAEAFWDYFTPSRIEILLDCCEAEYPESEGGK